jgi:hypothetical protein
MILTGIVIGAVVTGIAVGDAGTPPAGGYVVLTPAHKILNGTIGANASNSELAIGGATTVPTNATAVQLTIAVNDTKAGTLQIFPAGDQSAGGAATVSFPAGTTATQTVTETPGLSSKITFHNTSAATATVTATITGYSTQVTASNIASDGGRAGQVLSNTGSGAAWQTMTASNLGSDGGSVGQVLSNTGSGAAWQTRSITVGAGTGLTGGGAVPLDGGTTLNVDPTAVQSRINGTCTGSNAISSVNQDGTVGCRSTASVTQMMGGSIGNVSGAAGVPSYLAATGLSTPVTNSANATVGASSVPGTANSLFVRISTAPGTGKFWDFDLRDLSTNQHMPCQVDIGGSATTCTSTFAFPIAAGDVLVLQASPINGPPDTRVTFGWAETS